MNELYSTLALVAIVLGAFASTWVGKVKSKEPYDPQQLISSIIISAIAGFATIQWDAISSQVESIGLVGTAIGYLIAGFALDKGLSKLDTGMFKSNSARASPGGSGVWGTQNTLNEIHARISRLEFEIIQSEKELDTYSNMSFTDANVKQMFLNLIKREISKTQRELDDEKARKAGLIQSGWLPA